MSTKSWTVGATHAQLGLGRRMPDPNQVGPKVGPTRAA